MVEMEKLGFSFLTNSHAAFSANVLLARYPIIAFSCASSCVIGFQSSSEYTCPGQKPLLPFTIAANEDVITTCLTDGALFLIDLRIPVVPITAGSIRSCLVSRLFPSCSTLCTHFLDVGHVEVKRAGSVEDSLKWRV